MENNKDKIVRSCPIHGGGDGKTLNLNLKSGNKCAGYWCASCNGTIYVDTDELKEGLYEKKAKGFRVVNLKSSSTNICEIYVSPDDFEFCTCGLNSKLYNSKVIRIHDIEVKISVKKCNNCGKFFISRRDHLEFENANKLEKNKWRQNKVKFIDLDDQSHHESQDDFTKYGQNDVVPRAYFEANIHFNPYQYLPWLKTSKDQTRNILISDEVGLGKTIEAGIIIMEKLHKIEDARVLVICPAFLRVKWMDELKEKFYLDSTIFENKMDYSQTAIDILPISMLKKFNNGLQPSKYDLIVVDEIHYFRNPKSNRYKYLKEIVANNFRANRVFMSATPINNKSNDYQAIRALLGINHLITNTTKRESLIELPQRIVEDIGVSLTKEENTFYELTRRLHPFSGTIYRHIGGSCLYGLKRYAERSCEENADTLEEIGLASEELWEEEVESGNDRERLQKIGQSRLPEVDSKLSRLGDLIESIEDNRLVVFSHYIETIKYLFNNLKRDYDVAYIYGNNVSENVMIKNPKNKFQDVKNWFFDESSDTKKILICSDSCKEGVDLQKSNVLINYDLPFNPSILEQRIGRIDRNGQNKNMKIYNFHVVNTYDDRLDFILKTKLLIINDYAQSGVGNRLRVNQDNDTVLDAFVRYFKSRSNRDLFSNEDRSIICSILRKVGIAVDSKSSLDKLMNVFESHRNDILHHFTSKEIEQYTKEQLVARKAKLEWVLNFPHNESGEAVLDDDVRKYLVEKINNNPVFRLKMSQLIVNYQDMLEELENTGNPINIEIDDLAHRFQFSCSRRENNIFISRHLIEELENEGAVIRWK